MSTSRSATAPSEARAGGHLLRILGVGFGIAVVVGNTIGSGILLTPGSIAAQLKHSWLVIAVWAMGGAFAFFCTQAVVELGTMLPQAGGWFVYSRRAFGEYGGFLVGCCDWMVQSAAIAYLASAFGEFFADLANAPREQVKLIATACLVALMLLNWLGLRVGSRTQQIMSLAKALALLAFVLACFFIHRNTAPAADIADHGLLQQPIPIMLMALFVALQSIIVSYDGWYGAIYFAEEDEDPDRNLPRSSIAGVLACAAIFLLVNAALLHILPFARLAASHMPVADAAQAVFGARGRIIILVISLVTAISTINASLLITPRILFAMARCKLMPASISSVNAGGTPVGALLLGTAVPIALVLSGSFQTLLAMASILFVAVYLSGFLAVFVLRFKEPDMPRPSRMWGYPWTNLAICLGTSAFLIAAIFADLKHALFTVVTAALTYPLYLAVRSRVNQKS
jgi:APA family basic amino acid/polyamine antiporter